jgi:hypothetical protein
MNAICNCKIITRQRIWLRHYVTGWKVAGPIPNEITGFFNWANPSSRGKALGSVQPLTKMSTRNLPGGKGSRCVRLTTSQAYVSRYIWNKETMREQEAKLHSWTGQRNSTHSTRKLYQSWHFLAWVQSLQLPSVSPPLRGFSLSNCPQSVLPCVVSVSPTALSQSSLAWFQSLQLPSVSPPLRGFSLSNCPQSVLPCVGSVSPTALSQSSCY